MNSKEWKAEVQALRERVAVLEEALAQTRRVQLQWQQLSERLRQTHQSLIESRDRFLALFEHASSGMIVANMQGEIQVMNPEALRLFEYSEEEQPEHIRDLLPDYEAQVPELRDRRMRRHSGLIRRLDEVRMCRRDGSDLVASVALICIVLQGSPLLLLTVQDLTRQIAERERHQAERRQLEQKVAARASRLLKLSQALEAVHEPIVIVDAQGTIEYANPAYFAMWGYEPEEVLGAPASLLKSGEHDDAFYAEMWRRIMDGEVWEGRLLNRCRDGRVRPVNLSISPVIEHGQVVDFVGIYRDLVQQEKLARQVLQTQKMEAISTLVGGISHEFNNILAGMTGNLYLARMLHPEDEEMQHHLSNAEQQGFKAAEMIQKLMVFARKDWVEEKEIDLNDVVAEITRLGRLSIPENIQLDVRVASQPLIVHADASQIQQMILHLVQNAHDALKHAKHGRIRITLEPWQAHAEFLEQHGTKARHYARMCVWDNGIGIRKEDLPHIFEPFYTSKDVGEGTGLGLSAVFGVVERLGGSVDVHSQPGDTCFEIFLPIFDVQGEESRHGERVGRLDASSSSGSQAPCILLVDDEEGVLSVTAKILRSLHYEVIEACDGQEAVSCYEAEGDRIDLVVTDIIMPKLGGIEAVARMRRLRSNLPVIFMTGYDQEYFEHKVRENEYTRLILKPLRIGELSRMIHAMMDD